MKRRGFFTTIAAAGVGAFAIIKSSKAFSRILPSDPQAKRINPSPDEILLPAFDKDSTFTLDQALLGRQTQRSYDADRPMSLEQVSRIMWAANGVNREDGHLTSPSAMAYYPVEIYAVLPEGVYQFDPKAHKLVKVINEDILRMVPIQPGLKRAQMKLLYVYNSQKVPAGRDDICGGGVEIGCMVQNVYLEAVQLGLGCCVFGIVQYDKVSKQIGLKDHQSLRIAQAVGYQK